jgi:hypothetical protein
MGSRHDLFQHTIVLDNVYRQTNPEFVQVLNKVRMGLVDDQVQSFLQSKLVPKDTRRAILRCDNLGPDTPVMLSPYRRAVDAYNRNAIQKLKEEAEILIHGTAYYTVEDSNNKVELTDKDLTSMYGSDSTDTNEDERVETDASSRKVDKRTKMLLDKERRKREKIVETAKLLARELLTTMQAPMKLALRKGNNNHCL